MQENQSLPSNNGEKTADGRFAAGNTFGRGRPQGSRNKASLMLEEMLDECAPNIMQKAILQAARGDPTCIKICLDRILPKRQERTIQIAIPKLNSTADAMVAIDAVVGALTSGDITPSEAKAVSDMIEAYCRVRQCDDFNTRLQKLEQAVLPHDMIQPIQVEAQHCENNAVCGNAHSGVGQDFA